ncbi:hypothetical protein GUJ93_ZPchr0009g2148 [Zizania palustris]|uniref:Uncharacterized protein n=1 Tax=Zizania palustris TaxID=103762 RepID=A0A8J5RMX7_ZIZPA|nr:hypothetical protein GUJ93_ZPchr0009g2148 [Zizania palustris]
MVRAALEAIDFRAHAGTHSCLEAILKANLTQCRRFYTARITRGHRDPRAWCSFPVASFADNDELCGAPLPRSSSCRAPRRLRLLGAEVSVIVAAIAVVSATVCVALLYIMLRMWSNWPEGGLRVDLRR